MGTHHYAKATERVTMETYAPVFYHENEYFRIFSCLSEGEVQKNVMCVFL